MNYWSVRFDPQLTQVTAEYKFAHIKLVWESIDITWGKFPQHERPVLQPDVEDMPFCRSYTIRDHSGTKIGTCEWYQAPTDIHIIPTHF